VIVGWLHQGFVKDPGSKQRAQRDGIREFHKRGLMVMVLLQDPDQSNLSWADKDAAKQQRLKYKLFLLQE
jgi:hypothetical protein